MNFLEDTCWRSPIFDPERTYSLENKTVVITGANAGIGFATATECAKRGAHVVLLCRNEKRMFDAKQSILISTDGRANVTTVIVDLKSFDSVRNAAEELQKKVAAIDILILNAGVGYMDLELIDGIHPLQVVNHYSHFLLVNLLFDKLNSGQGNVPRVVSVSSSLHMAAKGDLKLWQKFDSVEDEFLVGLSRYANYAESKLANILHMKQLAILRPDIRCFSVHPGFVSTEIGGPMFRTSSFVGNLLKWFFFNVVSWFAKTPFQGAQCSLYCAIAPECNSAEMSGGYFSNCAPATVSISKKSDEEILEMQRKLWTLSEEYTNSSLADKKSC